MKQRIWVDADACPRVIKDMLYRAAERVQCELLLVANQPLSTPPSRFVRSVQVASGYDVADQYIAQQAVAGELAITADIPLAAELLAQEVMVLTPRGERLTRESIGQRLNMRDFMETLRASGVETGGPPPLHASDRKRFADQLDRLLAQWQSTAHRNQGEPS